MKISARATRYSLSQLSVAFETASLGVGIFDKFKIFYLVLRLAYQRALGEGASCLETIKIKSFGKAFNFHITSLFDLRILKDIFVDGEYKLSLSYEPKTILDIGGNVGVSSLYFSLKYPQADIYVFEPDPNAYKQLVKNTSFQDRIHTYPYAVTDTDGLVKFYSDGGRSESSSLLKRSERVVENVVEGKSLATIMKELQLDTVDILKLDIEGGEWSLLSSIEDYTKLKTIVGEVHLDLINVDRGTFMNLLSDYSISTNELSETRFIFYANRTNQRDE